MSFQNQNVCMVHFILFSLFHKFRKIKTHSVTTSVSKSENHFLEIQSWNEAGGMRNRFSTPPGKPTACSSGFWYTTHTHTHHTEAVPHHCHRAWKMKNPWVYAFWFLNQQCFDFGFATAEREAAYYLLHYWQEDRDVPVCVHVCEREFCVSVCVCSYSI